MSKLFFDDLINLGKLEKKVKKVSSSYEERLELWQIIDEIIHHQVIGCVLDHLPKSKHSEFLDKFYAAPHDQRLIVYLKREIKKDVLTLIKEAITLAVLEIIGGIDIKKKIKKNQTRKK